MLGRLVAMIVDQGMVFDEHPPPSMRHGLTLLPTVGPAHGGATAGLFGRF